MACGISSPRRLPSAPGPGTWLPLAASLLLLTLIVSACSSTSRVPQASAPVPQPFRFPQDAFAFSNQTFWVYRVDPDTGRMTHQDRQPPPDFAHRCFVVVQAAKKFHLHARFDPDAPQPSPAAARDLAQAVLRRSDHQPSHPDQRVVIPGYTDVSAFSEAHEEALKETLGGAWQSYAQRGHWRMILPFSRRSQSRFAEKLLAKVIAGQPAVVHIVRFPALTINHAVLAFDAVASDTEIRFFTYDPNNAAHPVTLTFHRASSRFEFPPTPYFAGGRVDAYEVYRSFWY